MDAVMDRAAARAGALAELAPLIRAEKWEFGGRDDRGWLVFYAKPNPDDIQGWAYPVIRYVGIGKRMIRLAVLPIYFWRGHLVEGQPFMEVTWR